MEIGLMTFGDHLPDPLTGKYEHDVAGKHRSFVEQAVLAEELGFHSVHLGEHHGNAHIISAPPVILAAIAERTSRIRVSTAVTLATHLDPVRMAEDYATLDALSGGRVEIIVGRGAFTHAFEIFGQELEGARETYAETVRLFQRLLAEEKVSAEPRFRPPLRDVTTFPRPVQRPHPPIWVGAGSEESVDMAAELGMHFMAPTVFGPAAAFGPVIERFRERSAAAGHNDARVGTSQHAFVAPDSQDARKLWRPYYDNYLQWVNGILTTQPGMTFPPFDVDYQLSGPALCGSPAEVIDQLGRLQEETGSSLHLAMFDHGGLPESMLRESIELFGTDVLPAFA